MFLIRVTLFGLLVCFADALKIDVTINGNHVQSIPKGSDVILNCSASQSDSADRLDWLKDNQSITENVVLQSVQGGVLWSSLLLQNVFPANVNGMYTCRSWKNNSRKATVQQAICVDDIRLRIRPRLTWPNVGDSRIITCKAQGSCNSPNLQWLDQSGEVITDQDKIQSTSNTELKLKLMNLKVKDKGEYKCRAMDSDGREVKRSRMYINVKEWKMAQPPIITSSHQEVLGYHGNNVTLSFITQHTPQIVTHPTWYFGGEVLHNSNKYTIHKPSFSANGQGFFSITVHSLTEEDSGNYTLRVTTTVRPPAIGHVQLHAIRRGSQNDSVATTSATSTTTSATTKDSPGGQTGIVGTTSTTKDFMLEIPNEISWKSWIPITLASLFILAVVAIGLVFVRRHEKLRSCVSLNGCGCCGRQAHKELVQSPQAKHNNCHCDL